MAEFIKSPLNYVGGKYKLLPQIIPLFPDKITTFIDLFGGGANVSINANADKVIYNDISLQVVQVLEYFKKNDVQKILSNIDLLIDKYSLSKTNSEGYLELREKYNNGHRNPIILYTLICYSFNNQIRFNSKGEYNMPFGKDRSSFNEALRGKFIKFCEMLHQKNIIFTSSDFQEYATMEFDKNTFIYCDPPYLNTMATYNERSGWTTENEQNLRTLLEDWTVMGIKWGLSNNISVNTSLKEWAENNNYTIHNLSNSYGNCNYHKKDKNTKDIEVLITNY